MKELERTLADKGFARCHTSYLVNLFYVKGIKKLTIELITGETIPISQPKRKEFIVYPICGASIFSSFGCMYLSAYLYDSFQRAYRIQQLEAQCSYYKDHIRDEERVRSIYHDLKNHLLVLENGSSTAETQRMAEKLHSRIVDYGDYVHTGNEFLDIILKDKAAKAHQRKIDFSAMASFDGIDFMEPLDISTIFGNALDNAIEASEALPEDKRLITVKAEQVRDMLLITVENNTQPGSAPPEKTAGKIPIRRICSSRSGLRCGGTRMGNPAHIQSWRYGGFKRPTI